MASNSLENVVNSNYDMYEYYPEIGLSVFKKTNSVVDKDIFLGHFVASHDQQTVGVSWTNIYPSQTTFIEGDFNSKYNFSYILIDAEKSWT